VPIIQILSVPMTLALTNTVVGAAARAIGNARLLVAVTIVPTFFPALGLVAGFHNGLLGATLGSAAGSLIGFVYSITMVAKSIEVPIRRQLRPLAVSVPAALVLYAVIRALLWLLHPVPAIPRCCIASLLGAIAYAGLVRIMGPEEWKWFRGQAERALSRLRARTTAA
jgi:hypothetical protein